MLRKKRELTSDPPEVKDKMKRPLNEKPSQVQKKIREELKPKVKVNDKPKENFEIQVTIPKKKRFGYNFRLLKIVYTPGALC